MLECRRFGLETLEAVMVYWRNNLAGWHGDWHDYPDHREERDREYIMAMRAMLRQLARIPVLEAENVALREEVAALNGNRLQAFTQKEVADVATILGDYLQVTDEELAFREEWRAELKRREVGNGG